MGHNLFHSQSHSYIQLLPAEQQKEMNGSALGLFFLLDCGINLVCESFKR